MSKLLRDFSYSLYAGSLKLFVRSVGHFRLKRNFEDPRILENFGEIVWCVEGSAYFYLEDKAYLLQPNQVWYYPPGSCQRFKPGRQGVHFWQLSIEGELVQQLCEGLGLQGGLQNAGACPEEIFSMIAENIGNPSQDKCLQILAAAFQILTMAASGKKNLEKMDLVEELKQYVDEHFHSSSLNVCRMAEVYHMHRVVLNRKFKAAYAISLSDYIISKRLHEALGLLKNSSLALSDIARQCGFSSSVYFNKAIRKATGRPPGKLRELFAL